MVIYALKWLESIGFYTNFDITREEKPQYCNGKGCILIDDMEKNIREWNEMGGTGIVNLSATETMVKLKELGII